MDEVIHLVELLGTKRALCEKDTGYGLNVQTIRGALLQVFTGQRFPEDFCHRCKESL